jgi:hypothetical protein
MAGNHIIRLRDIGASKCFLNAWTNGKVVCPDVECKRKINILEPSGLAPHYRIMHPNLYVSNSDEKLLTEAKEELMSRETLNNLNMLSDMRSKQVRNWASSLK